MMSMVQARLAIIGQRERAGRRHRFPREDNTLPCFFGLGAGPEDNGRFCQCCWSSRLPKGHHAFAGRSNWSAVEWSPSIPYPWHRLPASEYRAIIARHWLRMVEIASGLPLRFVHSARKRLLNALLCCLVETNAFSFLISDTNVGTSLGLSWSVMCKVRRPKSSVGLPWRRWSKCGGGRLVSRPPSFHRELCHRVKRHGIKMSATVRDPSRAESLAPLTETPRGG